MTATPEYVVRALVPALVAGVACYVLLRWAAVPLLAHLETGVEYALNVLVIGFLLPEYCWTRAQRRVSGHAAPFAYTYGDAVCAVASAGHRCTGTVLSALREATGRLGHQGSLCGGLLGAGVLLWAGLT
ncbi:hypothetical protein [Streptomyces sp. NPDC015131]|uniref:hypothetical protein n=1 Tax=Streptomyces sp. NPDC015131 TaxID=3364941 RepID=UPI0036FCA50D